MKIRYILYYNDFDISYNSATRHPATGESSTARVVNTTLHHTTPCFQLPTPPSRDIPKQHTTITTPPPQLQRGGKAKDPSTLPSGEHRGRKRGRKVAAEQNAAPTGEGR
jgi:hypothetical protein